MKTEEKKKKEEEELIEECEKLRKQIKKQSDELTDVFNLKI